MTVQRVRSGSWYRFDPVVIDRIDPPYNLQPGDVVQVTRLHGCPPPNTMGHAHVMHADGTFAGLVHCNSLKRVRR